MIFHTKVSATLEGGYIEDEFHNEIPVPGETITFRAELRPLTGDEKDSAERDLIVTRFRLFYPRTIMLTALCTVNVNGQEYKIVGQPEPHSIGGRVHHYEVLLERITG
jgi:hypothetical protein